VEVLKKKKKKKTGLHAACLRNQNASRKKAVFDLMILEILM
jgi:hypothetical protein